MSDVRILFSMSRPVFVYSFLLCIIGLFLNIRESSCAPKSNKTIKPRAMPKRHELSFSEDDYKMLNFSMVLPINETTKKIVPGGMENQTVHLFERIRHLVDTNNSSMEKIESIKFWMADLSYNYVVNHHIRENFVYPYPGTTLWEVGYTLPMNASVAAEVIAHVPLPSRGYDKNRPVGREYDRLHSPYKYQLHEIPGRSP